MPYFLLVSRDSPSSPWAPQFGDHERDCVEFEREEAVRYMRDHEGRTAAQARGNVKITRFPRVPTERQTLARCAELN